MTHESPHGAAAAAEPLADLDPAEARRLHEIARHHRRLLGAFLLQWMASAGTRVVPLLWLIALPATVAFFVYVFRTLRATGAPTARRVLYCVGVLVPLVNLFVLFAVSRAATRPLQQAGIRVGLMGVSGTDLERLAAAAGM